MPRNSEHTPGLGAKNFHLAVSVGTKVLDIVSNNSAPFYRLPTQVLSEATFNDAITEVQKEHPIPRKDAIHGVAMEVAMSVGHVVALHTHVSQVDMFEKLETISKALHLDVDEIREIGIEAYAYGFGAIFGNSEKYKKNFDILSDYFSLSREDKQEAALRMLERENLTLFADTKYQDGYVFLMELGLSLETVNTVLKHRLVEFQIGRSDERSPYLLKQAVVGFQENPFFLDKDFFLTDEFISVIDRNFLQAVEQFQRGQNLTPEIYFYRNIEPLLDLRSRIVPPEQSLLHIHPRETLTALLVMPTVRSLDSNKSLLDYETCIPATGGEKPVTETDLLDFFIPIMHNFSLQTIGDVINFISTYPEYTQFCSQFSIGTLQALLTPEDLRQAQGMYLRPIELEALKQCGIDIVDTIQNPDIPEILFAFRSIIPEWNSDEDLHAFEKGANVFGFRNMLHFISRKDIRLHDKLLSMDSIINLYKYSGLSVEEFCGNILFQVQRDEADYENGSSYHALNDAVQIARIDPVDLHTLLSKASKFEGFEELSLLQNKFSTTKDIFSSWAMFKRYTQLVHMLEKADSLEKITKIQSTNPELFAYVKTLIFHTQSKVDINAVMSFLDTPQDFFDVDDPHVETTINNEKKPSNLVNIPYLPISAEDIRNAIVDGTLDTIGVFPPMAVSYSIPSYKGSMYITQRELISDLLGSPRKGIAGKAPNSQKLFTQLQKICNTYNTTLGSYLSSGQGNDQLESAFQQYFQTQPELGVKFKTFTAEIHGKKDPHAAISGNAFANCMPFGQGKTNVYLTNPNTSIFTLHMVQDDNSLKTIAGTVLTKDKNIGTYPGKSIEEFETMWQEKLFEPALVSNPGVLAWDDVETAHNYRSSEYKKIIEAIYLDFFRLYLHRVGKTLELDTERIISGMQYTQAFEDYPVIPNTFVPQIPLSYSDKNEQVILLNLPSIDNPPMQRRILSEPTVHASVRMPGTIQSFTFEDSLGGAAIETFAYRTNRNVISHISGLANGLVAAAIHNARNGFPNLSVKATDEQGKMQGYLLAYQGVLERQAHKEPIIYISDLASSRESSITGPKLIKAFVELYKKQYLSQGNIIPIVAHLRDSTSYKLIKKGLLDYFVHIPGYVCTVEELSESSNQYGGELFHPIVLSLQPISARR